MHLRDMYNARNFHGAKHMELIDIGCNLTHDSFDDDLDEVLQSARDAGVAQIIVTGASNEGMTSGAG